MSTLSHYVRGAHPFVNVGFVVALIGVTPGTAAVAQPTQPTTVRTQFLSLEQLSSGEGAVVTESDCGRSVRIDASGTITPTIHAACGDGSGRTDRPQVECVELGRADVAPTSGLETVLRCGEAEHVLVVDTGGRIVLDLGPTFLFRSIVAVPLVHDEAGRLELWVHHGGDSGYHTLILWDATTERYRVVYHGYDANHLFTVSLGGAPIVTNCEGRYRYDAQRMQFVLERRNRNARALCDEGY